MMSFRLASLFADAVLASKSNPKAANSCVPTVSAGSARSHESTSAPMAPTQRFQAWRAPSKLALFWCKPKRQGCTKLCSKTEAAEGRTEAFHASSDAKSSKPGAPRHTTTCRGQGCGLTCAREGCEKKPRPWYTGKQALRGKVGQESTKAAGGMPS